LVDRHQLFGATYSFHRHSTRLRDATPKKEAISAYETMAAIYRTTQQNAPW